MVISAETIDTETLLGGGDYNTEQAVEHAAAAPHKDAEPAAEHATGQAEDLESTAELRALPTEELGMAPGERPERALPRASRRRP